MDMCERIERIERHASGFGREAFLADEKTADSVVRNLEVIGEAASRLPDAFRRSRPEVPWGRIVGLRNRVVHAYFDVDLELVWEIVHAELPSLKVTISTILQAQVEDESDCP